MNIDWKTAGVVALGFVVLIPAVLLKAWTAPTYPSIKPCPDGSAQNGAGTLCATGPTRTHVDEWAWKWLNYWYANSEDGVSGQQAYIWDESTNPPQLVRYMPTSGPRWRAYCWNARNNANNYKRPKRTDSLNKPWTP